ncbi:hypothetical protein BC835DRAFT_901605 [Cytidiella melzeri]|nr:hypothetical protein BC835DRAFT_901605 [Cytidiella melzeri]
MESTSLATTKTSNTVDSTTGTIHLTSSRNDPVSTPKPHQAQLQKCRTKHSHAEIWQWTLTQRAVAPCRVEDIYSLQECDNAKPGSDPDYFWLGHVPCRFILIYGMVVGVNVYEKRILYTVDDGSGKIDCNLREGPNRRQDPKGISSPAKHRIASVSPTKQTVASSAKISSSAIMTLQPQPKPIAAVGDIVRVVGRVLRRHNSRLVNLDSLTICHNVTEEPRHWLSVLDLHEKWYHDPSTTPFVIPEPPKCAVVSSSKSTLQANVNERMQSAIIMPPPSSPVSPSKLSVASSAPSTPSSVASSSVSSHHSSKSPPRLRHPSRLHTRDLTANTFRIYVKHYMDNAPSEELRRAVHPLCHTPDSSDDDTWRGQEPGTPTKARQQSRYAEMTPKASRNPRVDETPKVRPMKRPAASHIPGNDSYCNMRGYALSHLRRVPELALLARRVVEAEHKRRAKDQRKKLKEETKPQTGPKLSKPHASCLPSTSYKPGTSAAVKSTSVALGKGNEGEPISAKMKRLFRYAIRQLYEEGSIVMWDGPIKPLPRPLMPIPQPSFTPNTSLPHVPASSTSNRLWKSSISTAGDSTVLTSISSISQSIFETDIGELSDPPPEEESYIPLTSPYLAKVIESAIKEIMSRPMHTASRSYKPKLPPPAGPTVLELVNHLHRRDERWARVGEWAVKQALEWGKEQGRIWCIGDGRWELCG